MFRISRRCLTLIGIATALAVSAVPASASAATSLAGTVTYGSSPTRAAGTSVNLYVWTGTWTRTNAQTTTNAAGNYQFTGLPDGHYYQVWGSKALNACPGTVTILGAWSAYFLAQGGNANAAVHLQVTGTYRC